MAKFSIIHLGPGDSTCLGTGLGAWFRFCYVEGTGFNTQDVNIQLYLVRMKVDIQAHILLQVFGFTY